MLKNIKRILGSVSATIVLLALAACGGNEAQIAQHDVQPPTLEVEESYRNEPQLEQEVINLDYILVTNASNGLEPQGLRKGDEFLGLILENFEVQEIPFDPAGIVLETVIANFSGEIEVSGELQFWEAIPDAPFIVHEQYHHLFPQLMQSFPRNGAFLFFIQNQTELLDMLGIDSLHELSYVGYSKELTLRINNFTIMHDENGISVDRADVIEVISVIPKTQDHAPTYAWQEAYAEILWQYAELPLDFDVLVEFDWGWNFILHDINQDGIPELILVMRYFTGHFGIYAVYTFTNNEVVSLEFDEIMGEVGLFAPPNNAPGVVFSQWAGSGAMYSKMGIEGNTLSIIVRGFHHLSEEGFEKEWEQGIDFEDSYEWRVLTINDEPATVEEFEDMFGAWGGENWLRSAPITEDNIRDGVFGWNPNTRYFYLSDMENSTPSQGHDIPANTSNPFAAALLEFNAGGTPAPDNWLNAYKAIMVSIDNYGTQGMLASRLISPDGSPVSDLRLFAMHGGEISYLDVGGMYAIDMYITEGRRIVEAMHHWGSQSYTLFGIENGRLARDFSIHVMLNDEVAGTNNEYSFIPGGLWEDAVNSTHEIFEGIRTGYGLDDLTLWSDFEDETEHILAMTFE